MSNRISALLLAAAAAGLFAPAVPAWAQANDPAQAQAGAGLNSIQKLDVAEDGSAIYVRLSTQAPLAAMPASFTQANPPRIVFDFPSTGNGLGRGTQSIELGDLRSATIAQVGDRTRLVLNLSRLLSYDTRVAGNAVTIALSPGGAPVAAKSAGLSAPNLAAAKPVARKGQSVSDINFRRGAGGEGRVVVQLSSAEVGVDVQQQGGKLVVSFLKTALPDNLRRRSDVTDFGTPVTALQAEQQGENVRLTVTPNGLWEHNAYQSDDQFILEVRRLVEDPEKLVQRSGGRVKYAGNKLSLNFQNVDVRSVLQVVADFTDFNIVTSDSVQGNLTLRLKDVPWDQALDIILQAKGLDMRKNGNVIWIAPGEELAAREKLINEARAQVEELEPLQTETFQINYHRATEITQFLQAKGQTVLSKRGSVVVDGRSNKVFVTDVGSRLADVRRVITEIDVAPRQVLIEARIVEASKNFARDLGVKLGYGDTRLKNLGGGAQLGFGQSDYTGALNQDKPGGVVPAGAAITSGSGIGSPFGQLGLTLVNKNLTRFVNIELQVQEQDGKARTISSPRVLTANNVEAMIEQGNEIPYQEASSSGSTSTSFKKAVLALKVKPQITPDGRLQLAIQVNKDRPLPGLILNGRSSEPPLETKSVKSDVLVENGGTVVIGGIYTDEEKVSVSKVPLLGDIPVLGHLFRTTSKSTNETELLIFVTPRIVDESLTLR